MSELSSALGGDAPRHVLTVNGKTYTLSLITQGVKVAYEKRLFHKARMALSEVRAFVDKDYYENRMDELIHDYKTGGFAIESEYGQTMMKSASGVLLLLSLLMGERKGDDIVPLPESEVTMVLVSAETELLSMLSAIVSESFPGIDLLPKVTAAPTS